MPGKFDNERDEYVYSLTLDGDGPDEESGSVDETGYWAGFVKFSYMDDQTIVDADVYYAAIVTEDSSGFVNVSYWTNEEMDKADQRWQEIRDEHLSRYDED